MRILFVSLAGIVAAMVQSPAAAKQIAVTFRIDIDRVFGPNAQPLPATFSYVAKFDTANATVQDDGVRTYTHYAVGSSTAIQSDVFSLMPLGAQVATPYQIIEGRQNDYPETFLTQIGFSDVRTYDANGFLGQTVTETFVQRYEPSKGGTGTADGPLTNADLVSLLKVGTKTSFFIFNRIYDPANTRTTYEGSATIVSVAGIPEPASWALMICGFGLAGAAARRRVRTTARSA